MQVRKKGEFYFISNITGPRHNGLLISFFTDSETEVRPPVIEGLVPLDESRYEPLDGEPIFSEVVKGVQQANSQFGTNYQIKKIQYFLNDSPRPYIYSYMAFNIVRHLAQPGNED